MSNLSTSNGLPPRNVTHGAPAPVAPKEASEANHEPASAPTHEQSAYEGSSSQHTHAPAPTAMPEAPAPTNKPPRHPPAGHPGTPPAAASESAHLNANVQRTHDGYLKLDEATVPPHHSCAITRDQACGGRFFVRVTRPGLPHPVTYKVDINPPEHVGSDVSDERKVGEMVWAMIREAHDKAPGFKSVACNRPHHSDKPEVVLLNDRSERVHADVQMPAALVQFLLKPAGKEHISWTMEEHKAFRPGQGDEQSDPAAIAKDAHKTAHQEHKRQQQARSETN